VVLPCAGLLRRMRRQVLHREKTRAKGLEAVPSMGLTPQ